MAQQPARESESVSIQESLTKLVDIQRPHSAVQSNKPKLQSRRPSAPTSRFKAFLFPPVAIGAVAYIFYTEAENG